MKYPILYKSNETDFFAMGLGPIQMLKATVTQERNGIFIFEGEILIDNPLFPLVLENYIIKADADHLLKDQRFRIKRIVPNHDGKAQIYAEHVSYLSRELTIKPEVNITGSAQVALSQWKASIVESNPFVVSSDITTSASTKWRIDKVENPMMALGGVEGSILDRWGGEYLFDNYHISLLKKRGKTATNILAYGRNITDFEQERNILSTYTSIAPYAIYTDDNEKEVIVTVDGFVVDSEHVDKFPNRVTKPIDFSSEFGSDEIPTKARLTTLAQQYITDNEIGVPTTSIKISFLDLSQTADYADYAFLEQVNLCDDVRVHYPKLGVNTIAKVVRVVWNCLTESYDEIEIGQKRMSLASQIQEQNKIIQEINTQVNQSRVSADGKNMIFYGLYGENGLGEPNAIKIGDSWFKPNGLETELYVWTGIEWKLIMDTSDTTKNAREIEATMEEVEEAKRQAKLDAEQALADAKAHADGEVERIKTELSTDIGGAIDLAEQAKQDAIDNANQALADAKVYTDEELERINTELSTDIEGAIGSAEEAKADAVAKANQALADAKAHADEINTRTIDTARLNAKEIITEGLVADVIEAKYIKADTAIIEKLFATEANIDILTAKTAFINSIKAVEIDASKITSGTIDTARLDAKLIVTEGLEVDVIEAEHIKADTATIEKLFADEANINTLTAKTAFINSIKAVEIDAGKITSGTISAARLDAKEIITEGLVANVIKAAHISADTALFDKLFTSTLATDRLSAQTAWIKNGMFANASIDGAKITNATIGSAKIIDLDAGKITAGTLNAGLVTVSTSNGNKQIAIDSNGLSALDSNGKLRLSIGVRDLGGVGQSDPSNIVFYSGNGNNSMYLGTNTADTFVIAPAGGNMQSLFSMPVGLTISSRQLRLTDPRGTSDYIEIRRTVDGTDEMIVFPSKPFSGQIGSAAENRWFRVMRASQIVGHTLNVGYGAGAPHLGDLSVGVDSGAPEVGSTQAFVRSKAVYNRIYGSQPTVCVTDYGTLGRIVSARKYKEHISQATTVIRNAKDVLKIVPSEWCIKGRLDKREYGFIADDFHEQGLTEVVQYGSDGQVEGLAYDRISMYHNVILQDHEKEISALKTTMNFDIWQLKNEIKELKNEINSLRQAVA